MLLSGIGISRSEVLALLYGLKFCRVYSRSVSEGARRLNHQRRVRDDLYRAVAEAERQTQLSGGINRMKNKKLCKSRDWVFNVLVFSNNTLLVSSLVVACRRRL